MARTKQTARKSTIRTTPPVSDADSGNRSGSEERSVDLAPAPLEQGTKRALEQGEIDPDAETRPLKKQRVIGTDPVLRNRIHFRMHSIAELVLDRYPSLKENYAQYLDNALEKAKHQLIEEIEHMLVDEQDE